MKPHNFLFILLILVLGLLFVKPSQVQATVDIQEATPTPSPSDQEYVIPTCLNRGSIPASELNWLFIPESAEDLRTQVPFVFLAGQLIKSGAVDASTCLNNGLLANGAANACGLALARPLVMEMQNMYDDEIYNAGEQIGVPPYMLKQVFRFESQFWPGQWDELHFGLGHLTPWGASTALLWNPDLRQEVCQSVYGQPCPSYRETNVYTSQLIGALLNMVNADCPNCPQKIDVPKAEASVRIFAQVLMAHCTQSSRVIYNITGEHSGQSVDYATIWRMTLFNYNVGPYCLRDTLEAVLEDDPETTTFSWIEFEEHVPKGECRAGVTYVDQITKPPSGTLGIIDENE